MLRPALDRGHARLLEPAARETQRRSDWLKGFSQGFKANRQEVAKAAGKGKRSPLDQEVADQLRIAAEARQETDLDARTTAKLT